MKLLALLAAAAALLVPAASADDARVQQWPDDVFAVWSPDARYLAFTRNEPWWFAHAQDAFVVAVGHGSPLRLGPGTVRGWRPAGDEVLVQSGSGSEIFSADGRELGGFAGSAGTWSPDGGRIAYVAHGELWVADGGGQNSRVVAAAARPSVWDLTGPVWSPDGTRIAFSDVDGSGVSRLKVVNADGSDLRIAFTGPNQNVNPSWSPDGTQLTLETNGDASGRWFVWRVNADGSGAVRLHVGRVPQWSPNGRSIAFVAPQPHVGAPAYELDAMNPDGSGVRRLALDVHPYAPPRWSPTGLQIAYSAGRECLRWGVYVELTVTPAHERRLSNVCRFDGTARADLLVGTPFRDFFRGFAGNDVIHGREGPDRIEGNGGNDVLDGGDGANSIFGGPGSDRIAAGRGNDLLVGGPGRDVITAGLGRDRIEARDGYRDVVDCGGGSDDFAEVDRLDVVRNCEHVLRPRS